MELHPCACGDRSLLPHRLVERGANLVAVYSGVCTCGAQRLFELELAEEVVSADQFGGAGRSSIIDAAQFLETADRAARAVPVSSAALSLRERELARSQVRRARSAILEVLKFRSAEGEIGDDAFFTPEGRAMYESSPERFAVSKLEVQLAAYERLLREL
ncbi:MAG: hypothetical protein JO257_29960 [Deltaproteobacteria bacterium]|nr:hypothetical protein [Deltaproteobacteria bacterium]